MSGADVSPEIDEGVVESIELVSRREAILAVLTDKRLSKPELVERVGKSRSTIDRAIRALEGAEFVTRTREGYETTAVGRVALDRYRQFLAEEQTLLDAMEVLAGLPAEPVLPMSLCQQGTAERFEPAYGLFEQLAGDLREADRYRAILPEVVDSRQVRLCHRLALEGELDVELLVDRNRLRRLGYEYPTLTAELADIGALRALAESPPFALSLVGGHRDPTEHAEGSTLRVSSYDEDGESVGVFETSAEDPVEWGEDLFASHRKASQPGGEAIQPAVEPSLFGNDGLPLSLRSEGLVRIDADHTNGIDPMEPTTAWRAGLGLTEVQAGYALPRRSGAEDRESEWLADYLFERLHSDSPVALLGPPGCGKSTVCKQVACDWPDRTGGTVLYRESGRGDPLDSIATLQQLLEREQRAGPVLVVVEDAVRAEANAIFELLDQLPGGEDVSVLLDARTGEWTDPEEFPIDARLEAIRQEQVEIVHVPRLTESECERFVEQVETLTGRELAVSPTEILEDIHDAARETVGDDEQAIAGEVFLLFHRLARTFEPLDEDQSTTVLEAHVERIRSELASRGETALAVGIIANVCNAAGLALDPAYLHTPPLAENGDHVDVRAALQVLEDECLFDQPGSSAYRGIHESWSVTFLEQVLVETLDAAQQFGWAVTQLLSLADEPEQRSALNDAVGETAALSEIALDPTAWTEETVEAIFELGRMHPKLAPLFEDAGSSTIALPAASSVGLDRECLIWLGRMCTNAGLYDRAATVFRDLPEDGGEAELERQHGLASVAKERGEYDMASTHATRALELATQFEDLNAQARSERLLGNIATSQSEYDIAREHLQRSRALCEQIESRSQLASLFNQLGNVAFHRSELDQAEEYYRRSLEIRTELGDRHGKAGSLGNLGLVAADRGELERAEEYFRRSLEIKEELGDRHGKAGSLSNLGIVAKDRDELARAEEYFEQSLDINEDLGDRHGKARSLMNLGIVAELRGKPDRAEKFHRRSLEIFEELGDRREQSKCLSNLGNVVWQRGALNRAEEYYRRSLELEEELGYRRGKAISLNNLGAVARERGALDQAEAHLQASLDLFEELGDRRGTMASRLGLGIVAIGAKNGSQTRMHLETARSISRDIGDTTREVKAHTCLGVVAHLDGDIDLARQHLTDALETAETLETPTWKATTRGILGAIEIAAGITADGRDKCDAALEELRGEAPNSTPRGVEVLWQHSLAESEQGNDEYARELCDRIDTWIEETGGRPGYAYPLVEQHREQLSTDGG
jgi:tetratricopeptide (TPR) repeat protein/DNA-binding transcriptional ArsR family regulator/energy-coupling factor transporter ATP-binding protein EcfA2